MNGIIEKLWTAILTGAVDTDWKVRRGTKCKRTETGESAPCPPSRSDEVSATYRAPAGSASLALFGRPALSGRTPSQIRFTTHLDRRAVTLYDGAWPRPGAAAPDGIVSAGDHLLVQGERTTRHFELVALPVGTAGEGLVIVVNEVAFHPTSPYHGLTFRWTGAHWEFHGSLAQCAQGMAMQALLQQVQGRYTDTLDQSLPTPE